jgi:hypothetical protein
MQVYSPSSVPATSMPISVDVTMARANVHPRTSPYPHQSPAPSSFTVSPSLPLPSQHTSSRGTVPVPASHTSHGSHPAQSLSPPRVRANVSSPPNSNHVPVYVMCNLSTPSIRKSNVDCVALLDDRVKKSLPPTVKPCSADSPASSSSSISSHSTSRSSSSGSEKGRSKSFTITQVPPASGGAAKGLGVFATKEIAIGSAILNESPVLMLPSVDGIEHLLPQLYHSVLGRLKPAVKQQFLALGTQFPGSPAGRFRDEADVVRMVMKTHTLEVELPLDGGIGKYKAIFLQIGRVNHRFVLFYPAILYLMLNPCFSHQLRP